MADAITYIILSVDSRANARPPSVLYASPLLHGEFFNQRGPTQGN